MAGPSDMRRRCRRAPAVRQAAEILARVPRRTGSAFISMTTIVEVALGPDARPSPQILE